MSSKNEMNDIEAWSSTSALSWNKKEEVSRANPQIWRIAEWLWNHSLRDSGASTYQKVRGQYYDMAKELNYMFLYNAFASKEDNHVD